MFLNNLYFIKKDFNNNRTRHQILESCIQNKLDNSIEQYNKLLAHTCNFVRVWDPVAVLKVTSKMKEK